MPLSRRLVRSPAFQEREMKKIALAALLAAASSHAAVVVSEVYPAGSGNGTYAADFFELYNNGTTAVDITGWTIDDSSAAFATSAALTGVTSLPAGARAVFLETNDPTATFAAFSTAWFGSSTPPSGYLIGSYTGSGIGLSTGGDAVVIFNGGGTVVTGVSFGATVAGATLDNTVGVGSTAAPYPAIATPSVVGVNSAILSANGAEIGSPGLPVPEPTSLAVLGLGAAAVLRRRR
jgi:hypothetical protein